MLKPFIPVLVAATAILLSGCMGAMAPKGADLRTNGLMVETYSLEATSINYSKSGTYVGEFAVENVRLGPKVILLWLDVSGFVKEAIAGRTGVVPEQKDAGQSVTILSTEADASISSSWKGPWARIVIAAEVADRAGRKRVVKGTGFCHMQVGEFRVFSKSQTRQVIRNAAWALARAIEGGKENVEVGNDMLCLADGSSGKPEIQSDSPETMRDLKSW